MKKTFNKIKKYIKSLFLSRKLLYIKSDNFHIFELIGQSGSGKTYLIKQLSHKIKNLENIKINLYEDINFELETWEREYFSLLNLDSKSNSNYIKLLVKHIYPRFWINKFITKHKHGIYFLDEGIITDVFCSIENIHNLDRENFTLYLSDRTFIYLDLDLDQLINNHQKRNNKKINDIDDLVNRLKDYKDNFQKSVDLLKQFGANVITIHSIDDSMNDILKLVLKRQG